MTFVIKNDDTGARVQYCKNGIIDLVKENIGRPLHKHIIYDSITDENGDKLEIAFQWGDKKEQSSY